MTKTDVLDYWLTVATEDLETAEMLIRGKKYHHGLFFCHLALEKLIKGLVVKNNKAYPLPIHDLVKLALQAQLDAPHTTLDDLKEITTWNIKARYDTYKREFYRKATKEFTKKWYLKVKELFLWIKKQY